MSAPTIFDSVAMESILSSLMDGHCKYLMDGMKGKVADLTSKPEGVQRLDCSGFVEYLFYKITKPGVNIPSGSANQEAWFKKRYTRVPYSEAASCDSILRVAFRDKTKRQPVRHVWFIVNGCTIESTTRGSNHGPASLSWIDRKAEASDCFRLGLLLPRQVESSWIPGILTAARAG